MECTKCPNDFEDVPLSALSFKARDLLANRLDKWKIIPSSEGLPRDYRGLAQLAGVACNDTRHPTLGVLALWQQGSPRPYFQDLVEYLGRIDRWDALEDAQPILQMDAFNFSLKQRHCPRSSHQPSTSDNHNIITYDDADLVRIGLPPDQRYDAYLLYADQDEDVAQEIVKTLESPPYSCKLCLKDRDILPGAGFEHAAITELITERCNRLIVVLTPEFIDCPAETFIYNYAIAAQINERRRKIVPCLFKLANDPAIIQRMKKITFTAFPLNFARENPFKNNWDLLSEAISSAGARNCMKSIEPPSSYCTGKSTSFVRESTSSENCRLKITELPYDDPSVSSCLKISKNDPLSNQNSSISTNFSTEKVKNNYSSEHSKISSISNNSEALLLPQTKKSGMNSFVSRIKKLKILKSKKSKSKKKKLAEALAS